MQQEVKQKLTFELKPCLYIKEFEDSRPNIFFSLNHELLKLVFDNQNKKIYLEIEN